jgi:hypothetical protein
MALTKVLLDGQPIAAGAEKRLLPGLQVQDIGRLHFHISAGGNAINGLQVRILFGTPVSGSGVILLADSTVWFEETSSEREFSFTTPTNYGHTGFVMSVPVVAPLLYDVILRNVGSSPLAKVFVTVLGQTTL